ncbi:hypothetical protein CMI47_14270 [Candidatus Pacearchaeota archaeon]|nr:hypothetical protein [Candidatus Pacearchaeota archaeon]|tara:strand:- start:212 stop:559 length:348 start_codon:yes stop_codon:yes gene_type:complete
MKITKRQLRRIIRESVMTESLSQSVKDLLDRDYEQISDNTSYPYGRNRGDVRSTTIYGRTDGQPVPEADLKLLKDRDADVRERGGPMAALSGTYTTTLSQDGMSLVVNYYRHTAG